SPRSTSRLTSSSAVTPSKVFRMLRNERYIASPRSPEGSCAASWQRRASGEKADVAVPAEKRDQRSIVFFHSARMRSLFLAEASKSILYRTDDTSTGNPALS